MTCCLTKHVSKWSSSPRLFIIYTSTFSHSLHCHEFWAGTWQNKVLARWWDHNSAPIYHSKQMHAFNRRSSKMKEAGFKERRPHRAAWSQCGPPVSAAPLSSGFLNAAVVRGGVCCTRHAASSPGCWSSFSHRSQKCGLADLDTQGTAACQSYKNSKYAHFRWWQRIYRQNQLQSPLLFNMQGRSKR